MRKPSWSWWLRAAMRRGRRSRPPTRLCLERFDHDQLLDHTLYYSTTVKTSICFRQTKLCDMSTDYFLRKQMFPQIVTPKTWNHSLLLALSRSVPIYLQEIGLFFSLNAKVYSRSQFLGGLIRSTVHTVPVYVFLHWSIYDVMKNNTKLVLPLLACIHTAWHG